MCSICKKGNCKKVICKHYFHKSECPGCNKNSFGKLLTSPDSMLKSISNDMKKYIATPWNPSTSKLISVNDYNQILQKYEAEKGQTFSEVKYDLQVNRTPLDIEYSVLRQGHGGNLFEHSKWSALQIIQWFKDLNPLVEGVDKETAYVAALFHDIGKGGDCTYDMYADGKYGPGKGDWAHPERCGDMILNGKPLYNICRNGTVINNYNIKKYIKQIYPHVNINEIALAAYMHWEFGRINIPGKEIGEKIKTYLQTFRKYCSKCNLRPSKPLLKLCIIVSCADISAGSSTRLTNVLNVPEQNYISTDPWVAYGMDKNYLIYRKLVLDSFK
jgi:hypothetical protein